jgi:hypothetical protein
LNTITWSVHSRRAEPIKRSTRPFCQGERNDVGQSRMPIAMRTLNAARNALSLSRMRYFGAVSHGNASVIWRANHSAVGLRVTANHNNCRRFVAENKKCEQLLKRNCRNHEQINRRNPLHMIAKEGLPSLQWPIPPRLCVPKIRFCNIGDEGRRGQTVM